ncbi:hypothetical protein [Nocardioides sp. CF8]|uniref:hypothetical protein n=1 Tax=Nocardioides sp. CF8 TaxID=110319 RepID=UPI000569D2C7|nr:hypothetical protein [Nocardioides sp. CF8]
MSQAANSGGNLLLAVFVARQVTPTEFGAWSIGYAAYMMALAVVRSLSCTPLLLGRHESPEALRKASSGAVGLALCLGLAMSVVVGALGWAAVDLRGALIPFALCMPLLLAQDVLRHFGFAGSRPSIPAALDVSWVALQCAAFVALTLVGANSMGIATVVWAISALPAVLWLSIRSHFVPRRDAIASFWRETRADGVKLLADSALASAVTQALPVLVAASAGLAAAGALRGGFTLMGGINVLVAGLTPIATLAARRQQDASGDVHRFLWSWSAVLFVVSVFNGALLLALPESLGRELLGSTWETASLLILPLALHSMLRGPFTGVPIALRASDRVGAALRLRVWTTLPSVVLPWTGALVFGLHGAVWGIVLSAVVANGMALRAVRRGRWSEIRGVAS